MVPGFCFEYWDHVTPPSSVLLLSFLFALSAQLGAGRRRRCKHYRFDVRAMMLASLHCALSRLSPATSLSPTLITFLFRPFFLPRRCGLAGNASLDKLVNGELDVSCTASLDGVESIVRADMHGERSGVPSWEEGMKGTGEYLPESISHPVESWHTAHLVQVEVWKAHSTEGSGCSSWRCKAV